MTEPGTFRLCVILPEGGIERVTLQCCPDSVAQLTCLLRQKLEIPFNFLIQFEDPEFNNQLVNLNMIEEIPNMGTVKLVKIIEHDISSTSSWTSDSGESSSCQTPQRSSAWPKVFPVPTFSHDIEFLLREANDAKQQHGRRLTLTKEQKSKILDGMGCAMYQYKAYPSGREIFQAAEALVRKHPCLEETGSKNGWEGWKDSLTNKMNNYRRKLCKSGCPEVKVNSGRRSRANPDAASPHASIKRPRRAEVNYLPQLPRGETLDTLEVLRVNMLMEMEKTDKDSIDLSVIDTNMNKTFAARRLEIVNSSPSVEHVQERWPALFLEHQVRAEYQRITNQQLRVELYAALDQHTDRLLAIAREMQGKSGRCAQKISSILKAYSQQTQDINVDRIAVLRCLPVLLQEDDSELFYTCKEGDPTIKRSAAIVSIIADSEDVNMVPYHPREVKVFLQDQVVLQGTECWPDALLYLYDLLLCPPG
ncbi:hypothetical protein ABVT39_004934 [Epinephelus coioides]